MADAPKEPPLGEEAAIRLVRSGMPELRWRSSRYIDAGWDHEVLLLDERLVVRVPNDDFYRAMLEAERVVLDRLAGTVRVALPRVLGIGAGGRFSVHEYVAGEPLTPERFAASSARDRSAFADQLAEVLTAIHGIDPALLPAGTPSWTLEEETAEVARLAAGGLPSLLTAPELEQVEAILADVPALLAAAPSPVLVHGDVYEDHLLWDAGSHRLGLIDFSDLATGDAAIDFAELIDYGRPFVEDVAARYGGRTDGLVDRAERYGRWLAVFLMTDHLVTGKTSFASARIPFDRRCRGPRPIGP